MHFSKSPGSLPITEVTAAMRINLFGKQIDEIIALVRAGRPLAEVMQKETSIKARDQREVAILIVNRMRNLPKTDYETCILDMNTILLEILKHLTEVNDTEIYKLLQPYYHAIHNLPGIKDEKGQWTVLWASGHLVDVGRVIQSRSRRNHEENYGHGSHGPKELKHL